MPMRASPVPSTAVRGENCLKLCYCCCTTAPRGLLRMLLLVRRAGQGISRGPLLRRLLLIFAR